VLGAGLFADAPAMKAGGADWEWPDGGSAKSRRKERRVSSARP